MTDYKSNLPTRRDFSPEAIRKALSQRANGHWTVRYSLPLVGGALMFGFVFKMLPLMYMMLFFVAAGASITYVYNMFLSAKSFEQNYVDDLNKTIAEQTEEKRRDLKKNLLTFDCQEGAKQLIAFQAKFDTLLDILKMKFEPHQLTYKRYHGIAQEVFLSGLDNLSSIVISYKTLGSIDIKHIKKRLKYLEENDYESNIHMKKEYDALKRSQQSYTDLNNKINMLLSENSSALVEIDQTTIAISEIQRSKDREGEIDMENSMKQLQQLAKRSQLYSR